MIQLSLHIELLLRYVAQLSNDFKHSNSAGFNVFPKTFKDLSYASPIRNPPRVFLREALD